MAVNIGTKGIRRAVLPVWMGSSHGQDRCRSRKSGIFLIGRWIGVLWARYYIWHSDVYTVGGVHPDRVVL